MNEADKVEYGEWCIGNMGTVGRPATHYVAGPLGVMPVVDWEDAPPDVTQEFLENEAKTMNPCRRSMCDCMNPYLIDPKRAPDGTRYCGYCKGLLTTPCHDEETVATG